MVAPLYREFKINEDLIGISNLFPLIPVYTDDTVFLPQGLLNLELSLPWNLESDFKPPDLLRHVVTY
jgi:hypothetical protein